MEKAGYGSDLPSVQVELESHVKEHKQIEKFHANVEKCVSNKVHTSIILKYTVLFSSICILLLIM